jgi:tripartite-type tricarboxylate transporter receptor subunit TctC
MAHDAAGGHFDWLACVPNPALARFIASGRLRVLAVGAPERIAGLSGAPTLAELGYADANRASWFGVYAPAATPPEIARRMHAQIAQVLQAQDVREQLLKLDGFAGAASIEAFRAQIESEYAANGRLIREAGIRAE